MYFRLFDSLSYKVKSKGEGRNNFSQFDRNASHKPVPLHFPYVSCDCFFLNLGKIFKGREEGRKCGNCALASLQKDSVIDILLGN